MATITNPILPGFNPDPSICRVGDDYYIATSTFEWWPGVQIHHSRDLVNWRLLTHGLKDPKLLDLIGDQASHGVWAPCLTHDGEKFHLVYSNVRQCIHRFWDVHNYVVTARDIMGPWEGPVYLNASGFDPSMFHDPDTGRKWVVNMLFDYRPNRNVFDGIVLQEYDARQRKLIGPIKNIFRGTDLKWTEGPHLYKRDGWYYLMCAEGGTSWGHAVTMARSRQIEGPYEVDPTNPIVTSREHPELPLQKAGHASIVETQKGEWYLVHLCARPLTAPGKVEGDARRCVLGRETAIEKMCWTEDGWLRQTPPEALEGAAAQPSGSNLARVTVPGPNLPAHPFKEPVTGPTRDDFDSPTLSVHLSCLRTPPEESWLSLKARPGHLRLTGRETLFSRHHTSLVAHRLQHFKATVTTCVEFVPTAPTQLAGLVAYYDDGDFYYIYLQGDEKLGPCLGILKTINRNTMQPPNVPIDIGGATCVHLRATFDHQALRFSYSLDGQTFIDATADLDATRLSDETGFPRFTGAFVGMTAWDLTGQRLPADFDYFEYVGQG
ncbi:MAG: glycoside hydrolase family 43 protein [Phycisphaeraceae bacterium]|nr:glycoside hydrolase family 43 protein [Phycisphaeraceae bacterium]